MSSALYTAIPLLVAILTFTSYIALGNTLDVATALTSLALFDLLRFPLFMLPMVSVDCQCWCLAVGTCYMCRSQKTRVQY
jgi:hypothetical protein